MYSKRMILSKATLLFFLNNELGGQKNIEVNIPLGENGEWIGRVDLKQTTAPNKDEEYLAEVVEQIEWIKNKTSFPE